MGIWTGIKAIFGTPKIVGAVADTVKSGMTMWDKSKFTDQEQSEMSLESGKLWLKIQEATANENSIRSITRRVLAWLIMGIFLFLVISACVIWRFNPEWAEYIKNMIIDSQLGWLTMSVGIFYFGSHFISGHLKKSKG